MIIYVNSALYLVSLFGVKMDVDFPMLVLSPNFSVGVTAIDDNYQLTVRFPVNLEDKR